MTAAVETKTAIFAGGCFWCVEAAFDEVPGVTETVSGYAGGTKPNPTYGDHEGYQEAVKVTYDPAKVTYAKLLDTYWHNIDPFDANGQFCDQGNAYRSVIFVGNDEEKGLAESTKKQIADRFKETVATEIKPATTFTAAEDYHQNYHNTNPVSYKFYKWNCGRAAAARADLGAEAVVMAAAPASESAIYSVACMNIARSRSCRGMTEAKPKQEVIYRHSGAVRVTHWVNVVALLVLLMSGLQIFNAHPALYLGAKSNFDDPVMAMRPMKHGEEVVGVTTIAGWNIDTTNLFGLAYDEDGDYEIRGFPWSVTLPGHRDLATGRRWHFFFAWLFVINGLAYLIYSLVSGHLRNDLAPSGSELKHIGASIWEHIRLKFPQGEEAKRYNVLQKLAYLIVALVLLPLMLATGLAMSPGMDAGYPFLLEIFGGRQSARTIHFIAASGIVLFVVVHLVMVLITGVWNNLRSMITGRYVIKLPEGQA